MRTSNKLQLGLCILMTVLFAGACGASTEQGTGISQSESLPSESEADSAETEPSSANQVILEDTLGTVVEGLNINEGYIDDITITEYFDTTVNPDKKPVVIFEHGLSGSRHDFEWVARVFAQNGYYVITPDAYLHGDRTEGEELSVVEAAVATADEIDKLLDYCKEQSCTDMNRIGLVGFSMGGLVCYYYLANGSYQVDAASIICSTPDWEELINNQVLYSKYVHGETKMVITPWGKGNVNDFVREHSPLKTLLNRSTGTDYLLIMGKDDTLMPFEGSVDFYTKMKARNENIEIRLEENHGHETTQEDAETLGRFFMEKLPIE